MATVERGCLAIGDITGYTTYLAGVELEHPRRSGDALATLLARVQGGAAQQVESRGD